MGNVIRKSDLLRVSYAEFGTMLDRLAQSVSNAVLSSGGNYDVIVPILRSGAFTAAHLAANLHNTNMLPAQYKSDPRVEGGLVKKFQFPELCYEIPATPQILVVDSASVSGLVSRRVVDDIRQLYPQAAIDLASTYLDQSLLHASYVRQVYYGSLTNMRFLLTAKEAREQSIPYGFMILPWENLEEQWSEIQAEQLSDDPKTAATS